MMDVMRTGPSLLAHRDPEVGDNSHAANVRKAERLLAQLPACWRHVPVCWPEKTLYSRIPIAAWPAISMDA